MDDCVYAEAIERWPIRKLIPYARNPRTHSPQQVLQIAASIKEFGFTNPILADKTGGVIAGHGRVLAAQQLGLPDVPVVVLDHLTDAQRRAYVIADNKLALLADWDEELLALELHELEGLDYELRLTGFEIKEIDKLLASLDTREGGVEGEDDVPDPPDQPTTREGDLWVLGAHRLICGDALKLEVMEQVMDGDHADMTFTDPPYGVDYSRTGNARRRKAHRPILNDDLGDGFSKFLRQVCTNILSVTDGAIYVCMASSELHTLHRAFIEAGGHVSDFLIWVKQHFVLGRADYQRQYEPILYGWKEGSDRYWCGARDQADVWSIDRPAANDVHPTMKPVELVERAIRNSSKPGDIVLDPFAGSGTTIIACEIVERAARAVELDAAYCDVVVKRWEDFTDAIATLGSDGRSFAEVREERAADGKET